MNISLILTTDKGLKACLLPETMLIELVKAIKEKGTEQVVLNSGEFYQVEGIYIPGKGNKSAIMVLPNVAEAEN
jgi:hypothetical protein